MNILEHERGSYPASRGSLLRRAFTRMVASIRPDPDTFLNTTQLDAAIKNLIEDGARNFSAPQLTVWHEAGNLYTNPNGSDGNGGPMGFYDTRGSTGDDVTEPRRSGLILHVVDRTGCRANRSADRSCRPASPPDQRRASTSDMSPP